jgi:hypothetical protein
MAFEVFKETGSVPKEFISVTEKMAFGMSRAFLDKYGVTNSHKAVILYDPDEKKIALHFSEHDPKFGFAVRISNPKHGAIVVAKSFFEKKQIDVKKYAGRYGEFEVVSLRAIGQEKDGEAFVISLKEREQPADEPQQYDDDPIDLPVDLSEIPF